MQVLDELRRLRLWHYKRMLGLTKQIERRETAGTKWPEGSIKYKYHMGILKLAAETRVIHADAVKALDSLFETGDTAENDCENQRLP